jgi:hypothetical protein
MTDSSTYYTIIYTCVACRGCSTAARAAKVLPRCFPPAKPAPSWGATVCTQHPADSESMALAASPTITACGRSSSSSGQQLGEAAHHDDRSTGTYNRMRMSSLQRGAVLNSSSVAELSERVVGAPLPHQQQALGPGYDLTACSCVGLAGCDAHVARHSCGGSLRPAAATANDYCDLLCANHAGQKQDLTAVLCWHVDPRDACLHTR